MKALPILVFVVLIIGLFVLMGRNRRRQAANQVEQADRIGVGTEVMTTSGLYGTVVAKHDDGTVRLSIAPGVEVRWEVAALRDAASLPPNVGGGLRSDDLHGGGTGRAIDGDGLSSPYDPPSDPGPGRPGPSESWGSDRP